MMKSTINRYGSVAIAFHWASAAIILALLVLGFCAAGTLDQTTKAAILRVHVALGLSIFVITVLRLAWWIVDRKPGRIYGMALWQAMTERIVHSLLYVTIFVMTISGIAMIALSGAGPILFGGSSQPLPNFWDYVPRVPHGLGGFVLIGLVAVHIGAALYHHFIKRDGLLARMGIGHGSSPT